MSNHIRVTPQEKLIAGSTPHDVRNWHSIPGVSAGQVEEINEINEERKRIGFIFDMLLARSVGASKIGIRLSEIDPKTGETIEDPKVFVWDEDHDKPGRDVTREIYKIHKEAGFDPHLRPELLIEKEGSPSGKEG